MTNSLSKYPARNNMSSNIVSPSDFIPSEHMIFTKPKVNSVGGKEHWHSQFADEAVDYAFHSPDAELGVSMCTKTKVEVETRTACRSNSLARSFPIPKWIHS